MGREWQIGDPVDYTTDGWMDAQNWGYGDDEDEQQPYVSNPKQQKAKTFSDEAWMLKNEGEFEDALVLINRAIEYYPHVANDFNRKAIILQDMRRYEDALDAYDRALSFGRDNIIATNKADCILEFVEMRKYGGKTTYYDLDLINEALKILPKGESNYRYLQLKGDVLERLGEPVDAKICYFLSNKHFDEVDEAERQLKSMENPNETYIAIAGTYKYQKFKPFKDGVVMDLVREPENIFDRDAIRVEIKGETVGYVANSQQTLIKEVRSASEIKNMNSRKAKFAFILLETYVIAKVI